MEKITISFDDEVSVEELEDLMKVMENDGSSRFHPRDIFHYSLRASKKEKEALENGINVTARDESGLMVGYLRVISDRAYIHYIVDVMVRPDQQGRRVGSQMVGETIDELKKGGFIKILLTAIPGKEEFYRRFGFQETMSPVMALRGEDFVEDL